MCTTLQKFGFCPNFGFLRLHKWKIDVLVVVSFLTDHIDQFNPFLYLVKLCLMFSVERLSSHNGVLGICSTCQKIYSVPLRYRLGVFHFFEGREYEGSWKFFFFGGRGRYEKFSENFGGYEKISKFLGGYEKGSIFFHFIYFFFGGGYEK